MISSIPKVALVLALFGVVPFAWGAITSVSADAFNFGMDIFGSTLCWTFYSAFIWDYHPLLYVWGSMGFCNKNGWEKCRPRIYTVGHSSIMGIFLNGKRTN